MPSDSKNTHLLLLPLLQVQHLPGRRDPWSAHRVEPASPTCSMLQAPGSSSSGLEPAAAAAANIHYTFHSCPHTSQPPPSFPSLQQQHQQHTFACEHPDRQLPCRADAHPPILVLRRYSMNPYLAVAWLWHQCKKSFKQRTASVGVLCEVDIRAARQRRLWLLHLPGRPQLPLLSQSRPSYSMRRRRRLAGRRGPRRGEKIHNVLSSCCRCRPLSAPCCCCCGPRCCCSGAEESANVATCAVRGAASAPSSAAAAPVGLQ